MDQCQTPAYALEPLLAYLRPGWLIWEPAAGKGRLAEALRAKGFEVDAVDVVDGHDFFHSLNAMADCQVTNPPFSRKYEWLEHSYELACPFALLMPVEMIGAKKAQVLFEKHSIEIIWMCPRVDFEMPHMGYEGHGAQFPVAWYTWGLGIGKEMTFADIGEAKRAWKKQHLAGSNAARVGAS